MGPDETTSSSAVPEMNLRRSVVSKLMLPSLIGFLLFIASSTIGLMQIQAINAAAVDLALKHIADAQAQGAQLLCGGKRIGDAGSAFLEPTVLTGVPGASLGMCDETFAPVAYVNVFDTEAEALARANDTSYGLAAYVFTRDLSRAFRLMESLEAGMIGINDGAVDVWKKPPATQPRVPQAEYIENLRTMITATQKTGAKVILLEAGAEVKPHQFRTHCMPEDMAFRGYRNEKQELFYPPDLKDSIRYDQSDNVSVDRIRVLGGRTVHWNAVVLRYSAADLREWEVLLNPSRRLDTVHFRHLYVHQNHIVARTPNRFHRFLTVSDADAVVPGFP